MDNLLSLDNVQASLHCARLIAGFSRFGPELEIDGVAGAQRTRKERGEQLDIFDCGQYTCRAIVTNEKQMTEPAVIAFYNQRGAKEKILDQMDNDFGWHYLPKSEMGQNAVFMLITAIIRNFYERLLRIDTLKRFGIEAARSIPRATFRNYSVARRGHSHP